MKEIKMLGRPIASAAKVADGARTVVAAGVRDTLDKAFQNPTQAFD
jgi:hypothetical protein